MFNNNVDLNHSISNLSQFTNLAGSLDCINSPLLFHLNVQRVPSQSKFSAFVEFLETLAVKPIIVSIVETWFLPSETGEMSNSRNPISMFQISGYKAVYSSRENSGMLNSVNRSGGLAVYVRNDFEFQVIDKSNGEVSFIHLEILSSLLKGKFFYTSLYMPKLCDYKTLFDSLECIFQKVGGHKHVVQGDMNVNPEYF